MPGGGGHAQVHCGGSGGVGSIGRLHLYTWRSEHWLASPDMGTLTFLLSRSWSATEVELASAVN